MKRAEHETRGTEVKPVKEKRTQRSRPDCKGAAWRVEERTSPGGRRSSQGARAGILSPLRSLHETGCTRGQDLPACRLRRETRQQSAPPPPYDEATHHTLNQPLKQGRSLTVVGLCDRPAFMPVTPHVSTAPRPLVLKEPGKQFKCSGVSYVHCFLHCLNMHTAE